METKQLKAYAPKARREFIAAVTARAALFGLTANEITPATRQGDLTLIQGTAFPKAVGEQRAQLAKRIQQDGFDRVMEAIAYTWFNRLMAIRFMELHGYLEHGYRVLSHPSGAGSQSPEILEHATEVDLPGLDRDELIQLKLEGNRDEELYRRLLLAQCHALHQAMPFLFERLGDETELLLPDRLLHTDSLVRSLVTEVDEELWQEIEIIGWIYQFYISERKDEVIGKVVKSEDIPAATQLFTPNWIVKYMVQNSLGAQWLATYPDSPLRRQMEYYIEPAEQTEEVKAQLAAITPKSLNPEQLTLMDPACGSGHILVEAYDLFKAIYLERGYRQRDVPQLILEKNLFGLEIDERAAQLTGFALTMKGRADDRRLFERGVKLNVMALVDSAGFDAEGLTKGVELSEYGLKPEDLTELKRLFEHGSTFGSLVQVPKRLEVCLPALKQLSGARCEGLFVSEAIKRLSPLVQQADSLAARYSVVVANPPYMGGKFLNARVREFARDYFPKSKADLFAVSAERFFDLAEPSGFVALMTPFTWMFLASYRSLRDLVLESKTLRSLIQPEYHAIWSSAAVPICTFVIQNSPVTDYTAAFIKLTEFRGADLQPLKALEALGDPHCAWMYRAKPDDFTGIPGRIIGFSIPTPVLEMFTSETPLRDSYSPRQGLITGDNDRFLRLWHEVGSASFSRPNCIEDKRRWFGYQKGGPYRKWYGNHEFVVDWADDGWSIKNLTDSKGKLRSRPQNLDYFFRPGASWTSLTIGPFAFREVPEGFIFDQKGPMCFPVGTARITSLIAFGNSIVMQRILSELAPTLDYSQGPVGNVPFLNADADLAMTRRLVACAKRDWDSYERSWDFQSLPLLTAFTDPTPTLESSYAAWITQNRDAIAETKRLEEENNRLFIDAYGLQDELAPDVPIEQITLTVNPAYRYGGKLTEEEQWTRFRQDTMQELVSYAIGCMMGRYSLDEPGLIYAHSGNEGFDTSRYPTFPADADGIVPITDLAWFDDDAAHRVIEFLTVAWDEAHLEENLTFLTENLAPKKNESSRDTLRRYLATQFFKDHLKTYKKRPIYWLFSSGKQRAFQALVYLHRYHEGTLGRMRTEYVIPLLSRMTSRIQHLDEDIAQATSTSHRKTLDKEKDRLTKQRVELLAFDEKLRHYADQRIHLDLDDGVKVNYGKFGDLLAEVKKVHGKLPQS